MFDNAGGARHLLEHIAEVQRFARRRRLSNALLVSVIPERSRFAALGYRFRQIEGVYVTETPPGRVI
jgi:hypothetical protein